MSILTAFNTLRADTATSEALIYRATQYKFTGDTLGVELFADGTWREILIYRSGALYETPGAVFHVPTLNTEDWDSDPTMAYYDNALTALDERFHDYREQGY